MIVCAAASRRTAFAESKSPRVKYAIPPVLSSVTKTLSDFKSLSFTKI